MYAVKLWFPRRTVNVVAAQPFLPDFGDNFSFRVLLFLSEGAIVDVSENIFVDLIGLKSMREVSLPPAISLSHLGGFPIFFLFVLYVHS